MENPLKNQVRKLKRTVLLTQILAKYGFQDLLSKRSSGDADLSDRDGSFGLNVYERIRLAIEELGPTFVKFGQTLSSREDLLPAELIVELRKLQDRVPAQDIHVIPYIEEQLGIQVSDVFQEFDTAPFASASIAQVYRAVLKDGSPVILKIQRPNIRSVIDADLLILRDIVGFLSDYSLRIRQINLPYILNAFQNTLIEELSFLHEAKNIQQFAHNFRSDERVLCMQCYDTLSNDHILCISQVDGFKITDKEKILLNNISLEYVVDTGLDLYLTQVLEHGFFHADPHPGNILVTKDSQICFLDLGAMGRISTADTVLLEDFIVAFINQDADNLIYTIKKMAIHIDVPNEKLLKRDILDMFDMLGSNALDQIDIKAFFSKFSNVLNQNNILMPEHVYLLVRGIVLIEGIGRDLLPTLNIVEKIKPYIERVIRKRLSFDNIQQELQSKLREHGQLLKQAPDILKNVMQRLDQGDLRIKTENAELKELTRQYRKSQSINRYLAIGGMFFISGCLLVHANQLMIWGLPVVSLGICLIGVLFLIYAKVRSWRID